MIDLKDVANIEGEADSAESYFTSIQKAINSLDAWKFQGSFGRSMMDAITEGRCMLGTSPTADYYGSRIPSRTEVEPGTKGSRDYVVKAYGEDWAKAMEAV